MALSIQQYGLHVAADYRSVVFGAPLVAFEGNGLLTGTTLVLAGEGVLRLSGEGSVRIVGSGSLTVMLVDDTSFLLEVTVERNAEFTLQHAGEIDGVARLATRVELGEGAAYRERTALRVAGQLDVCTNVFHAASSSSQLQTRLVLEDGAKAIARGSIVIGKDAAGSHGSERLDALLLGTRAEADLLPTLSVANDDVACNHAATVGHADTSVLYYLQSRGLSAQEAKQVLAEAFLSA